MYSICTLKSFSAMDLLSVWERTGKQRGNLVLVCDNAPCHSSIDDVLSGGATLLRLSPYSPALNPIETVGVRRELRVPQVQGFGVGEQRLAYLEEVVQSSLIKCDNSV